MDSLNTEPIGQQYNLKWTNHTNNILEMFSDQYLRGNLVDVTFLCEGQYIKAHKVVLSACSPYFQVTTSIMIYYNFYIVIKLRNFLAGALQ